MTDGNFKLALLRAVAILAVAGGFLVPMSACKSVLGPLLPTHCHPEYSGACVPFASDVDCSGGSGNGPEYVSGTFSSTGSDPYGLDADGDGIACE
jgi:hypothetical protein